MHVQNQSDFHDQSLEHLKIIPTKKKIHFDAFGGCYVFFLNKHVSLKFNFHTHLNNHDCY